jgi:hypothetical protein
MPLKPLLALLVFAPLASPQSLPARETLYYTVEWRLITAGKAKLEWTSEQRPRTGAQVNLRLESVGLVSKFFKVEDNYSSNLNSALCGQSLQMTTLEGSRQRETKVNFDSASRKASYVERDRAKNAVIATHEIDIPPCVHDVIGGVYLLRTLNLEPGQSAEVPVSDGKKSAMAKVEAQQREDVKTPGGTFKTIRCEIHVFNDVLYHRQARLYIWLTDDRRKLPVQVQVRMQFAIGTITLLLEKAE